MICQRHHQGVFQHLLDEYNKINDPSLMENQAKLSAPYDANLLIETLWSQIAEAVAYAEAGGSPFTNKQVLVTAIAAVSASEVFQDDVKRWKKLKASDRDDYSKLKSFYTKVHRSWRKSLHPTAGAHSPHVNAATTINRKTAMDTFLGDLSDSLANLATATLADRATVATLTDTIAKISSEIASAQSKLITALMENQRLLKMVGGQSQRTPGGVGT